MATKAATKATPAKKATRPTKSTTADLPIAGPLELGTQPAQDAQPRAAKRATRKAVTGVGDREGRRTPAELVATPSGSGAAARLLAGITARPAYAPELLAQAAVVEYGPQAKAWAEWLRASYPGAPADGLARLAVQRYTRLARGAGAAAVLAGQLGPAAGAGMLGILQARLVLHIAAAYGVDPTAPERASELLVLTGAYRNAEEAHAAIQARAATQAGTGRAAGERAETWWTAMPLVRWAGTWVLWRAAGRLLPGAAVMLGAHGSADAIRRLAVRAAGYYRTVNPND